MSAQTMNVDTRLVLTNPEFGNCFGEYWEDRFCNQIAFDICIRSVFFTSGNGGQNLMAKCNRR